ncbi:MAG: Transmembrane protein 11, mitochondrial, partial [Marteilia pararefringens]
CIKGTENFKADEEYEPSILLDPNRISPSNYQLIDHATALNTDYVIIENPELGKFCLRCIRIGNFMHKCGVICSTLALFSSHLLSGHRLLQRFTTIPLTITSVLSSFAYYFSANKDALLNYQPVKNMQVLFKLSNYSDSHSAFFLMFRDNSKRKLLQNILCALNLISFYYKVL